MSQLNLEMLRFIDDFIAKNPTMLFAKMQKTYQQIDVPAAPETLTEETALEWRRTYYRTHFWDFVDLTDSRLLFTPALEPKIKDFFEKILKSEPTDTIVKYTDVLLEKSQADSIMYRYLVEWTSLYFQETQIMDYDAVFVHIAKKNQLQGKCRWMSKNTVEIYRKRVQELEKTLIGVAVPELIMHDTTLLVAHSTREMTKPYIILWFYDPQCHTCLEESGKLQHLYDSLEVAGRRNFDVYAVASNYDDNKIWKNYLRQHNYPWTQVGGKEANYDYLDFFNLAAYPSMFIIDRNHRIIANRRISIADIPAYLKMWENKTSFPTSNKQKQPQ